MRFIYGICIFLAAAAAMHSAAGAGQPVRAQRGVIVSVSQPASQAGLEILRSGGNAVDAAVATALALAVTWPEAGNIGGGGFMLIRPATTGQTVCVDYRETAPAAARENMFADRTSHLGRLVVGVPGTLRGLELAHRRWGKLAWPRLVQPAIRLADDGFLLDAATAASLNDVLKSSADLRELRRVYGPAGGGSWQAGQRLVQKELARTLRTIAIAGADAFYIGAIADQIVADMKAGKGLITREDLAGYRARVREPVHGTFHGYDIYAPPPPSSGGIVLIEILNILETFPLRQHGRDALETVHLTAEAMRRAYRDRAQYLGDPDFATIPPHLTSKAYAQKLAAGIDPRHATPSASLAGDIPLADEGSSTTHFSVVDGEGNAVSNTYTLEQPFGSRVVVRGAGFLLNNEMGDFNWRPGHTDRKGAIGTAPNRIAPGKRMLSSQAPTIVTRQGKLVLVTGSPGGRTIPNTVLCVLLNVLEFDMDLPAAVAAPRLHQPWFPDQLQLEGPEQSAKESLVRALRERGHRVTFSAEPQGDAHSIGVQGHSLLGVPDRRNAGFAAGY